MSSHEGLGIPPPPENPQRSGRRRHLWSSQRRGGTASGQTETEQPPVDGSTALLNDNEHINWVRCLSDSFSRCCGRRSETSSTDRAPASGLRSAVNAPGDSSSPSTLLGQRADTGSGGEDSTTAAARAAGQAMVGDSPQPTDQDGSQRISSQREIQSEVLVHIDKQHKLSPLENVKTLPELLELIPSSEDQKTVRDAVDRARKAFKDAAKRKKKEPKALVEFVKESYTVEPDEGGWSITYEFKSKEHPDENIVFIDINPEKGIMSSDYTFRGYKKDKKEDDVFLSDLQRYCCITDDEQEISIKEYHEAIVTNDDTKKIARILHDANVKLSHGKVTNGILNLTRESAAFMPFLGTDMNISKIFLTTDLGLSIQSVAIQDVGSERIRYQMKFTPDS